MGKNAFKTLKETFRKLAISPFQRQIEHVIQEMHPEAGALMEKLGHPRLYSKTKRNGKACYADGDGINLVTSDATPVAEEAEMVYAAMIDMAEKKGIGNEVLSAERREINSRIYADWQGDPTRFKISDLDHGATGRNAKILRSCMEFLEGAELPQCGAVAKILKDHDMTVNLRPVQNSALSGSFSPDSKELTLFYDPRTDDLDTTGKLCLTIIHETCHFDQDRKGIMADMMEDANAYREIFHLNELQAHVMQYKTAFQLFTQGSYYQDFSVSRADIDGLGAKLGTSPQLQDRICFQHLCQSGVGTTILFNLQQHSLAEGMPPPPSFAETLVKEALCFGEITAITENGTEYSRNQLSRMQRYAHSHISVLNHTVLRGEGLDFETAVLKHFETPLGLEKTGNTVPFADRNLSFVSPVTNREISVGAIEMLWEGSGFKKKDPENLGQAAEKILSESAPEPRHKTPKSGRDFNGGAG